MRTLLAFSLAFVQGCSAPADPAPPPPASSGGTGNDGQTAGAATAGSSAAGAFAAGGAAAGASAGAGASVGGAPEVPNPLGRYRCRAPDGMGAPSTIEQTVTLLNALPRPTTVACFLESLKRPLAINATSSLFSAQPAFSSASPRVFLKFGQLWTSIVIDGESSELVEFGYTVHDPDMLRSIKAELHFPLTDVVKPSEPYDRVLSQGTGSVCSLCHYGQRAETVPGIDNVFSSVAFRPVSSTRVAVESLRLAAEKCDWTLQPHRCEMLDAIFGGGPVVEEPFPSDMLTFF